MKHILIVTSTILLAFVVFIGFMIFGHMSLGNRLENSIQAAYDVDRNQLSTYTTMIAEAAQVPAMQRDDLTKVVEAALSARYGDEGSKAMFQFISEQNPQIDSTVYVKLQQIIQSGRTDFKASQDRRIDVCRTYKTSLGHPFTGFWLRLVGYPKMSLDKYCEIVVLDRVDQIFESKKDQVIQLR